MWIVLILQLSANAKWGWATEVPGPDGFSEIFKMPGASFKLELTGPDLSSRDRAIIREAGGGCPGRTDSAESEARRFSVSVATYVYHSQGSYEPSPLVHGGPIVAGANTPGWLKASWYPVQLRMPGSFRICYCAASGEYDFAQASGVVLGPNDSPCELDYAAYQLVGVAYAMGIKHSEVPIGACLVSHDGTLQSSCEVQVRADRGGLSAEDMAELVSGNPSAICGEAASGTTLLPLQGDAFAWKFQVPIGAEMTESYELETTDGLQRVLKVCYCEKQSIGGNQFQICSQADWQNAGSLSLVGFEGSPADVRCYRGQRCRLGRSAFGMSKGDAAIAVPGNSSCANLDSIDSIGTPAPMSILGGSTAVANIDVENYEGDLATICFCSAAVYGIFGCQNGQSGRVFNTLMGYVRSGGLEGGLRMDCVPTSLTCPETPTYLQGEDAIVAKRGKLFLAELKYRPCEDLTSADVQQATLLPGDASVRVEMPWPMLSGRYAICFFEDAIGCPQPNQVSTLQHIGELRVLGAIDSVGLTTHPGFATIPLQVRVVEEATGIRCCASNATDTMDCVDLKASATNAAALLSYPGTFRFPLVLQEPLTNYEERMAVNVSCAAMGQTGPCAPEAVTSGLSGFPCRQVHPLALHMQLPPVSWHRPWRRPVNGALGTEAMAEAGGYATQLKAVKSETMTKGICKKAAAEKNFKSLPCQATECIDLDSARATVPGHYELCVCEPGAVPMSQECQGWHHLGHLEVFGPFPLNRTLQGTSSELMQISLQGISLGHEDSLVSVPLNSAPTNTQTVCVGEGRVLPAQSTVHSPADWSSSYLRFDVALPEGIQALCWLPPGSGMLPYYLGFAEIFGERTNIDGCLVTPWQLLQSCSASCGAGKEIWYRRVLGVLEPNADCSVFQEERFCMKSPCLATVESWEVKPMKPMQDEPMELQIFGTNLSNDLHGVLVRDDGEQQPSSPKQGLCHYASPVASMVKCAPSTVDSQTCSFPQAPYGGGYQVCICIAEGPKCQAFLPALGTLQIQGLPEMEEGGIKYVAVILTAAFLLLPCLPLLASRVRKKLWQLWKKLRRRICGAESKVMAVPGMEHASEDEKDAKGEQDDMEGNVEHDLPQKQQKMDEHVEIADDHSTGIQGTAQPEEEPSQCSTARKEPVDATEAPLGGVAPDAPLQPEIPEAEVEGCKTPEELSADPDREAAPSTAPSGPSSDFSEKSRKERKRERKEERRRAREEKRQERRKAEETASLLPPRPLPPPPLRAPPRKLPSLPVSPSFDKELRSPASPAALEALAEATKFLQANTQKDGKFTDYGLSVKALSAALGRNDAELLAKALVDAERAGVGRELLEKARQHLKELRGDVPPKDAAPVPGDEGPTDVAEKTEATVGDAEKQDPVGLEEFEKLVEARAPEPPADLGAVDAVGTTKSEARAENIREDDIGVLREAEGGKMDEVPEALPEEATSQEEALRDEAETEEKDTFKVDASTLQSEMPKPEGREEDVQTEADADAIDVAEKAEATVGDAEKQDPVGLEEFERLVEARAPEPPADLGAVDAVGTTKSEARVENIREDDIGVLREAEGGKMDEVPEALPEEAPTAEEEGESKTSEAAAVDEPDSKDHSNQSSAAPQIEFPFSPLGGASCSLEWQSISREEPILGKTGDLRFEVSPVHRQEQCVEWQMAGNVTVAAGLERQPMGISGADELILSLTQNQEPQEPQEPQPDGDLVSARTAADESTRRERGRSPAISASEADGSTPALSQRQPMEKEASSSPGTDEFMFALAQRLERVERSPGTADGSAPSLSHRQLGSSVSTDGSGHPGSSLSQRQERMDRQTSGGVVGADDFTFSLAHRQERMDRHTSPGMSEADDLMFSLAHRNERADRQPMSGAQSSSGIMMDRPAAGVMGAGIPKEKRKSTPIRPSLTGSTLIDSGTLMMWKSGEASAEAKAKARRRLRRVRAAAAGRARPRPWAAPPAPGRNGPRQSDPPEIRHG